MSQTSETQKSAISTYATIQSSPTKAEFEKSNLSHGHSAMTPEERKEHDFLCQRYAENLHEDAQYLVRVLQYEQDHSTYHYIKHPELICSHIREIQKVLELVEKVADRVEEKMLYRLDAGLGSSDDEPSD
ncbi:hypothetical protein VKT23_008588 [Stygiomarasmius scandens]|uniref:Uncharacterized protein n=1 Tax=Marasmiellus scandens TaxID=2682957 RepID=A0ABR1JLI7_9AGAR